VDAARGHALVRALDDDGDAARLQHPVDGIAIGAVYIECRRLRTAGMTDIT
jgi:hypothetical protein